MIPNILALSSLLLPSPTLSYACLNYQFGDEHPGAYDGEPDVFVLRDILQLSKNRAEAESHM